VLSVIGHSIVPPVPVKSPVTVTVSLLAMASVPPVSSTEVSVDVSIVRAPALILSGRLKVLLPVFVVPFPVNSTVPVPLSDAPERLEVQSPPTSWVSQLAPASKVAEELTVTSPVTVMAALQSSVVDVAMVMLLNVVPDETVRVPLLIVVGPNESALELLMVPVLLNVIGVLDAEKVPELDQSPPTSMEAEDVPVRLGSVPPKGWEPIETFPPTLSDPPTWTAPGSVS
jgi:hypothetical protein